MPKNQSTYDTPNGLVHLHISHYALIESLDIDWNAGFSAITGETGAGKSIILGALGLLLGNRADAKAIQTGEKKCCVEGTFRIKGIPIEKFFTDNDIDFDAEECIIRREVMQTGKSRSFINDTPVPASKLKEIASSLIDIHSQHQNLLISHEHFLIDTLDIMAQQPSLPEAYKKSYDEQRRAATLLRQLKERKEKADADREYLQFQLSQIDEANIKEGEQNELEEEQRMLSHAEEIKQALFSAQGNIAGEDCDAVRRLRQAAEALTSVAGNYAQADSLAERLQSTAIELDDICSELERGIDGIEYDPTRLEYVEERLNTIYELEQKHHFGDVAQLLNFAEELRSRLSAMENLDFDIEQQQAEVQRLTTIRNEAAARLTESRRAAAQQMQKELVASLQNLGMPHVLIQVELTARAEPDASGGDNVRFLFSANKNVPPHDISQTASGGEIARVMLAIKSIIARRTNLPTIIFDEIDTGVSGIMAEKMALLMKQISRHCRVICITHLPQIAALANNHYHVFKDDSQDTTRSHITEITGSERVEEIAHMLSGEQLTDAAISNAKELLAHAAEI